MADEQADRRRYISVGVSFGDAETLARHGSGVAQLRCPACGAAGQRFGNPGDEIRYEGFAPLTRGGLTSVLCRCDACREEVTLPFQRAG